MSASSSDVEQPAWSAATRIAFRFVFSFFTVFYFAFPIDVIPFVEAALYKVWNAIIVATGSALFGITVDTAGNGSGDRTYNWIHLLVIVAIAIASTLIWSIADRKASSYPRLWRWFHMYIRFALAYAMIGYGSYKVIPSQFVAPSLDRLLQPFGDASPMGLLWTFMGASAAYTVFTGIGEMLGGLLLTNRRTALLGALITAGVMTHVVVLNFTYDVPVKIYASLLLATALVIAAPDAYRLLRFFILDRPSEPLFSGRAMRIVARVGVGLIVLGMVGSQLYASWSQRKLLLNARLAPSPLSGLWNVDELTVDGVAHPPLTTDLTRWRRLVVSGKEWGAIQLMNDSRTRYLLELDERNKTLSMKDRLSRKFVGSFAYRRPDAKTLVLDGNFDGKRMVATMHRSDDRTFLLTSRGFHWINESPFNR